MSPWGNTREVCTQDVCRSVLVPFPGKNWELEVFCQSCLIWVWKRAVVSEREISLPASAHLLPPGNKCLLTESVHFSQGAGSVYCG